MLSDRHYGTDSTDEFETLAEATLCDDGTIHLDVVQIDKREPSGGVEDVTQ